MLATVTRTQLAAKSTRRTVTAGACTTRRPTQSSHRRAQATITVRYAPRRRIITAPRVSVPTSVSVNNNIRVVESGLPKQNNGQIRIPRKLVRPAVRGIRREALLSVDSSLADVPLPYIRDALKVHGSQMLTAIGNTRADLPTHRTSSLPKTITVSSTSTEDSFRPTHMLAIHSNSPSSGQRSQVTFYPAHGAVLAATCSSLPNLPSTPSSSSSFILPVVPLSLPSPSAFPALQHYLYTSDTRSLLASLLSPVTASSSNSTPALLRSLGAINGVWRNACALGVSDDGLWNALDAAWETVLCALEGVKP
ncbi:hypothetical protein BD410DRAFT_793657 [Rickenella mellea]|uniref:Clp1-like protein n=1 Tax=Rickenella mellea TaxID=50990 RepID=A0A4Y7PRH8_9AGAM|nr:hypothetical protein BD410DRAFT_793657 [Rickenella mellea]